MSTLHLPDMGTDWLEGCHDQYIIISLLYSTHDATMFWTADGLDITSTPINAGRFAGNLVRSAVDKYNNGLDTVAVPMTGVALCILGLYPAAVDLTAIDAFMTIEKVV